MHFPALRDVSSYNLSIPNRAFSTPKGIYGMAMRPSAAHYRRQNCEQRFVRLFSLGLTITQAGLAGNGGLDSGVFA
jgi:hypothetical protein